MFEGNPLGSLCFSFPSGYFIMDCWRIWDSLCMNRNTIPHTLTPWRLASMLMLFLVNYVVNRIKDFRFRINLFLSPSNPVLPNARIQINKVWKNNIKDNFFSQKALKQYRTEKCVNENCYCFVRHNERQNAENKKTLLTIAFVRLPFLLDDVRGGGLK